MKISFSREANYMTMFSDVVIAAIHRVDNTKLFFFEDVTSDGVIRFEHTHVLSDLSIPNNIIRLCY